jgi:hypothetical protein
MRFVIVAAKVIAKSSASNNSKPDLTQRMWKATMMNSLFGHSHKAPASFLLTPASKKRQGIVLPKQEAVAKLRTRHRL